MLGSARRTPGVGIKIRRPARYGLPFDLPMIHMYNVHMKRLTASQARRNWFRLLDEIAAGEVVVIERKGRRIVLRREQENAEARTEASPDYSALLRVPDAERADRWGWVWSGPDGDLVLEEERTPEEADEDS